MPFGLFKKKTQPASPGPDFSHIDSNEKAEQEHAAGNLVKLYLMPLEFGGADNPMNVLYVPEFTTGLKARFDTMIEAMLEDGKSLGYSASPEYKGSSFIPSAIVITVTGDASIEETIQIW